MKKFFYKSIISCRYVITPLKNASVHATAQFILKYYHKYDTDFRKYCLLRRLEETSPNAFINYLNPFTLNR